MDREKVIKGLECLISNDVPCEGCPYYGSGYCLRNIAKDAMDLLKEQEARILDWDEIKNYPVVYGEFKGEKEIYPLIILTDSLGEVLSWNPGINASREFLLLVSDEEDRKNTRCWNEMPTEEQRMAVKWDD